MKPDLYNERTARAHYKKFKEVLYSPSVLNLSNDISDSLNAAISAVKPNEADSTQPVTEQSETTKTEGEEDAKETSEQEPKEDKPQEAADEVKKESTEENKEGAQKEEKDGKKDQEDEYNKMVKNLQDAIQEAKKNITPPNLDKDTIDLEAVYRSPLENDVPAFKPVKCLEYIGFSNFNPTPSSMDMRGDLFYLRVKTLEGPEYVITSSVRGFFVNNSTENSTFDPSVTQKGNPCFSHSLVGLMCQLSPKFSEKLEEHINKILKTDPF